METQPVISLIGVLVTSILTSAGLAWALYSHLSSRIQSTSDHVNARMDRVEGRHKQDVDAIRQEVEIVRRDYVRRDDLTLHLNRLEKGQDIVNEKLDKISSSLRHRSTNMEQRLALLEDRAVRSAMRRVAVRQDHTVMVPIPTDTPHGEEGGETDD